jgi:hypothetical protein
MKKQFLFAAIIAFNLVACNSASNEPTTPPIMKISGDTTSCGISTIVEQLENPYTVENMQRAYDSLQNENILEGGFDIFTTHYYVRFTPVDSAEYELLNNDTTLTLFPYPLDCILTEGEDYKEPDCPAKFGRLYTRVPVGYVSPVRNYEILDNLFMPTETDCPINIQISPVDWFYLLQRSELLTKNIEYEERFVKDYLLKATSFRPEATLKVYDDAVNAYIPVANAVVRARHFLHWNEKRTDANGKCTMPDKFQKVWWSIIWNGSYWKLRNGLLPQAYYNGPNGSKSNWDLKIGGGKSKAYAHVHRACCALFYDNICDAGFKNYQYFNGLLQILPLKISVFDNKNSVSSGFNCLYDWSAIGIIPNIMIWMKDGRGTLYDSYDIFSTTVHELTHTSQMFEFSNGLVQYTFVSAFISESWATCVEISVTDWVYQVKLGLPNYKYHRNYQDWALDNNNKAVNNHHKNYSPIFFDLIDNDNQRLLYATIYPDYELPDDDVSGFTITQIRTILPYIHTRADLKAWITALATNQTLRNNIDKLFKTYEKVN